jgi:hypothetical protein
MTNGPRGLSRRPAAGPDPDGLAIQALAFIAGDPEHASRFLALSGIDAGDLRRAAGDPGFLLGVMDYLVGDEPLLLSFAAQAGLSPEAVVGAHDRMSRR